MGIYKYDSEEIAEVMDNVNLESDFEGDFDEEDFVQGAKDYLNKLRRDGAYIHSRLASGKKQDCKICGRIKPTSRSKCPNGCKRN